MLDEVGMHCHDTEVAVAAFPPVWNVDAARPASHEDLIQDAHQFALNFARDPRALHQLNHDHDCTTTCIKYVAKQCKDAAQEALRKGSVVACRFCFFHILVFIYVFTALAGIAETITERIRRTA